MSVASEIDRIKIAVGVIRSKMIEAGQAVAGDDIETLALNLQLLSSNGEGVIPAYTTNAAALSQNWLSLDAPTGQTPGEPLTPEDNKVYIVLSDGDYYLALVTWTGTEYKPVFDYDVIKVSDVNDLVDAAWDAVFV